MQNSPKCGRDRGRDKVLETPDCFNNQVSSETLYFRDLMNCITSTLATIGYYFFVSAALTDDSFKVTILFNTGASAVLSLSNVKKPRR